MAPRMTWPAEHFRKLANARARTDPKASPTPSLHDRHHLALRFRPHTGRGSQVPWVQGCAVRKKSTVRARTLPPRRAAVARSEPSPAATRQKSDSAAVSHLFHPRFPAHQSHRSKTASPRSRILRILLACFSSRFHIAMHSVPEVQRIATWLL